MCNVIYTSQAVKDALKLKQAGLKEKAESLLEILAKNPFQNPPPYEKLVGDFKGAYSRRVNIKHRIVYEVYKEQKQVRILKLWTHYE